MRLFAFAAALACVLTVPAIAQTQAPAQPAKYVPPVKGLATIEVIQSSRQVGKELVTVLKIKNTSKGSINLLRAEDYWYDKSAKIVTIGEYRHKKAPVRPGEIIEVTIKSPVPAGAAPDRNQVLFKHANGEVNAKKVKEFK